MRRIQEKSPLIYASVYADQKGDRMMLYTIWVIEKYLYATLYSVTALGPNTLERMMFTI